MFSGLLSASADALSSISFFHVWLALCTLLLSYYLFSSWISSASSRHLPPFVSLPGALISRSLELTKHGPLSFLYHAHRITGGADIFRFSFFGLSSITVCLSADALGFFCESKDTQLAQQPVYAFMRTVFGPGVVYDAPYKIFFQQLKFLANGLSQRVLAKHTAKVEREAETYFKWKFAAAEGTADLLNVMSELILLTASRCLLGSEIRDRLHSRFAQLYHDLSHGIDILAFFAPNLPTRAHRKRDKAREEIRKMFAAVIAERRAKAADQENAAKGKKDEQEHKVTATVPQQPQQQPGQLGQVAEDYVEEDFLECLMRARYTDGRALSDEEIIGMLLAALFAGQHTSNITSTWLGFNLATHGNRPEDRLGKRLREEQMNIIDGKYNGEVTFDGLAELDLLHKCMKETLRLFPPLIFLMRKTLVPMTYKGMNIPANEIIVTSPAVTHRLPGIYGSTSPHPAGEFYPDRYSPPYLEDTKHKYAYAAFGGGIHKCLGERFAFMQIKTIWSVLLRNFTFELPEGAQFPEVDFTSLVTGPKQPCMIKYRRVQDAPLFRENIAGTAQVQA